MKPPPQMCNEITNSANSTTGSKIQIQGEIRLLVGNSRCSKNIASMPHLLKGCVALACLANIGLI